MADIQDSNLQQALRDALLQRNTEHACEFYVLVNQAQAEDLASGYVPTDVKAMILTMLDWQEDDRRRAARPVEKRRKQL